MEVVSTRKGHELCDLEPDTVVEGLYPKYTRCNRFEDSSLPNSVCFSFIIQLVSVTLAQNSDPLLKSYCHVGVWQL